MEVIATASRVGAVTITPTTPSIAVALRPVAAAEPGGGIIAMDVNKAEYAASDTNGRQGRLPNGALAHAKAGRPPKSGTGGGPAGAILKTIPGASPPTSGATGASTGASAGR